jgi:hypothetical protein
LQQKDAHMIDRLREHLTFSNGVALLALFVATGGSAYAATALPSGSVGTEQLQRGAVTTGKLGPGAVTQPKIANGSIDTPQMTPGAVTLNRLSDGVQRRLFQAGEPGPPGPRGPQGPGADRLHYSASATDAAVTEPVLTSASLQMGASCVRQNGGVALALSVRPSEDTTISETVAVDHGADITQGGQSDFSGNLGISVPGGVETVLGGPSADSGYVRAIASLIMPFSRRTVTIQVVVVVDAGAGRCSVEGTAVTAS